MIWFWKFLCVTCGWKTRFVIQHKPGTHLERKNIEVTLSLVCLFFFSLSEHDMKGCFFLLAEKTDCPREQFPTN